MRSIAPHPKPRNAPEGFVLAARLLPLEGPHHARWRLAKPHTPHQFREIGSVPKICWRPSQMGSFGEFRSTPPVASGTKKSDNTPYRLLRKNRLRMGG